MNIPDEIAAERIMKFKKTDGRTTTYGRLDPEESSYILNTYFDSPNVGYDFLKASRGIPSHSFESSWATTQ